MAPSSFPLVPRADQNDMAHMGVNPQALLDVWVYFNLVSNTILLPILVATFIFSKRAKRHPTLVNLCMTWIFSGVFSLLLFYAGQYRPDTPEPSTPLCIAQTSLLYGITPMWSVAVFVMFRHMIVIINGAEVSRRKMILMLASPYVCQVAFSIAALVISIAHPDKVNRRHRFFYCALKNNPLAYTMEIFTAVFCVGITFLEIQLAVILYRHWRGLKRAGRSSHFDPQLFIRVLLFGIYIFLGMAVNFIVIFDEHSLIPDLYAATIGTVLVLVFGTQSDIFRAWCFWRKPKPPPVIHVTLPPPLFNDDDETLRAIDLLKSA